MPVNDSDDDIFALLTGLEREEEEIAASAAAAAKKKGGGLRARLRALAENPRRPRFRSRRRPRRRPRRHHDGGEDGGEDDGWGHQNWDRDLRWLMDLGPEGADERFAMADRIWGSAGGVTEESR